MDMWVQPTAGGSPGTRRRAPVRLAGVSRRRTPTVSPSLSHRLDVLALVLTALIVVTGAAVRLTGSGLGCADWPECSVGHLTPALQFHGLVEFGNRLVTVVLTVAVVAAFLGSVFRTPRRRDLIWLSGGLVAGVVAQAVLGGIVVYTKLNPYVVMVHFFATMLLLVDAVVLVHRSTRDYTPGSAHLLVPRPLIRLFYGVLAILALVIAAGTATTGAGPHAGDASGQQVAKRIPIALRDMAELHSSLALLLIGVTIGLVVAPPHGRRARAGAPRRAHPDGGDGGPGRRRVHPVLHPPAGAPRRGPHPGRHRAGDRRRADVPRLHVPRPRGAARPARPRHAGAGRPDRCPLGLGVPCDRHGAGPHRLAA